MEGIDDKYRFTIKHIGINNTKDIILACQDKQVQSRIENIDYDPDLYEPTIFHLNFASIFFGFVDDMFLQIIKCTKTDGGQQEISLGLEIQSQSRLGNFDFGVNPSRISNFLQCIESQILSIHAKREEWNFVLENMHIANRGNPCLANRPKDEGEEDDQMHFLSRIV